MDTPDINPEFMSALMSLYPQLRGGFGPMGNPFRGGGRGVAGDTSAGPPIMDMGTLNQILQPYGVREPQTFRQPGPFENMGGFMGRHPGVAHGLDNALIAASLMGPSSMSAGDNISNAARGILGVGPYRQQYMAQQAMLPLEMAKEVGGLQAQQAWMKYNQGMGEYFSNRGQAAQLAAQAALTRANLMGAKEPRVAMVDGKKVVQEPFIDPKDPSYQIQWRNTELDPAQFERDKSVGKYGLEGAIAIGQLSNDPKEVAHWQSVEDKLVAERLRIAQATGIGHTAGSGVTPADQWKQQISANREALKGMLWGDKGTSPAAEKAFRVGAYSRMPAGQVGQAWDNEMKTRRDADARVMSLWGEYQMQPPEVQAAMPFQQFAQSRGFNPQTRSFSASGGPPQLSPNVQAIIGAINGNKP